MKKELKDYLPEVFVDILGYEGLYKISNWGRVQSFDRKAKCVNGTLRTVKGKILKTPLAGAGYPSILLYDHSGNNTRFLIHRLVGTYFIPNTQNLPEINHLYGDKQDNYFEHLEWATEQDNINHAFDTGLNKKVQKNDKHRSKPVIKMDDNKLELQKYPSLKEVERTEGFAHPNIHHAIKNKIKSHGYYWKYAN